jgi:uncharacterized protein
MSKQIFATPQVIFDDSGFGQSTGQCDCSDCDCACAEAIFPVSNVEPVLGLKDSTVLCRAQNSASLPLGSDHTLYYGPFHYPTVLNHSAQQLLSRCETESSMFGFRSRNRKATMSPAETEAIDRLRRARLLMPVDQPTPILTPESTKLVAWVHITDECNLHCDYCYLLHRRQAMSRETGYAVVDATLRSALAHGYQRVKFKYAGGEPLISAPLIREIHNYALKQGEEKQITIEGVVLSNGILLNPSIVQQLRALKLRLMVSLDGLGVAHDVQRHYRNGTGSFNKVKKGILTALEYGLTPDISITVTGKNSIGLPEVVRWVLELGLPFSLNLYRENEFSKQYTELKGEEETLIESLKAVFRVIEGHMPRQSLLGALADRANLYVPHLKTCGVGDNYLAFACNGQIAKCQMQLLYPITGFRSTDPLEKIRADRQEVQNLSVEEKFGCKSCQWAYWCTGGCPLTTYRATGRYDLQSPNCNIYRTIFPEILRLEGLRLLALSKDPT